MKTIILILLIELTFNCFAQTDTVNIFALPQLRIKQLEKGKLITYQFEKKLNKLTLTPNFLYPDTNTYKYIADINDIKIVYIRDGSAFWDVAGVTAAVGFALGFVGWGFFDLDNPSKFHLNQAILGGFITAIPFALIGGGIGAFTDHFEEYSLSKYNRQQKYEALKKILKKNSVKRE